MHNHITCGGLYPSGHIDEIHLHYAIITAILPGILSPHGALAASLSAIKLTELDDTFAAAWEDGEDRYILQRPWLTAESCAYGLARAGALCAA
jgi:hypothetical protein